MTKVPTPTEFCGLAKGYYCKKIEDEVNLDEPLGQDDFLRTYGLAKVNMMTGHKLEARSKM